MYRETEGKTTHTHKQKISRNSKKRCSITQRDKHKDTQQDRGCIKRDLGKDNALCGKEIVKGKNSICVFVGVYSRCHMISIHCLMFFFYYVFFVSFMEEP